MRALACICAVSLAVGLTGCGGGDDVTATSAGEPIPQLTTGKIKASFPVGAMHAYGLTEIKRQPKRIVTLGRTEHDIVLALGEHPVGVAEWFGDQPYATWPWARAQLGASKPVVLRTDHGIPFDEVAKLRPDLIFASNAGLSRKDYAKLKKIAPTIGPDQGTPNGYSSQWDVLVTLVASALGRMDQGDALIADITKRFAAVASAHPEFAGKTATFASGAAPGGAVDVNPEGVDDEFLTMLGFRANPKLTALASEQNAPAEVRADRVEAIDADVAVFATQGSQDLATLRAVPGFDGLGVVKDGRAVYADPTLSAAMRFMTPLSLRYVLDHLPPLLDRAVVGEAPQAIQGGAGT